jgi:hypothetical protein
MIRDVSNHHGARPDYTIPPNDNPIDDGRTDSDKAETPDASPTSECDPRRELRAVRDPAIVIDRGAGIDDGIIPDLRSCLHNGTRENDGSGSDPYIGTNNRRRMYNRAQLKSGIDSDRRKRHSGGLSTYCDDHALDTVAPKPSEMLSAAKNRQPRTAALLPRATTIFKKSHGLVSPLLTHSVKHHPAMTPCTPQRDLHGHSNYTANEQLRLPNL